MCFERQMISDNCRVSVVVPAYNSSQILPELVRQLAEALNQDFDSGAYEAIFVNDGSKDATWTVLRDLANQFAWIRVVNLRKNFGQHNALLAGLRLARGQVVILMDDDLQHSPMDIHLLLTELKSADVDVCYAMFKEKKHAKWKIFGSRFNDWTAEKLIGKPFGVRLSSFKAIKREVVDEIAKFNGPFPYVDAIVMAVTGSIANVEVQHYERYTGDSNYSVMESMLLWSKMAMNYSVVPLRIASLLGVLFSSVGLVTAIALTILKLSGIGDVHVPGWSSTVILILLVGGIQLLALGAIGEYLGRAYVHLNGKPQYLIKEKAGFGDSGNAIRLPGHGSLE
jgi:polyisoprenyl-phosphate glycosyltransferase